MFAMFDYFILFYFILQQLADMYRIESIVVWNGQQYHFPQGVSDLLASLPPSSHHISAYDCQPVNGMCLCV
jgi:hypothetical protein